MNAARMLQPLESRTLFASGIMPAPTFAPYFQIVHNALVANWKVPVVDGKAVYPASRTSMITPGAAAGGVAGQSTIGVPDTSRITLDADGVLTLRGTSKNDAFEVYSTGTRIEMTLRTGKSKTAPVYVSNYDAAEVKNIVVNGYGGSDVLHVNAATQIFTRDVGVETRQLELPHGVTIPNIASTPFTGAYRGSAAEWLKRSQQQIDTAAKSGAKAGADVALLGDSMLAYFNQTGQTSYANTFGPSAVDLGLPGDGTSQLLYRINNQGLLDGLSPRVVVLNIGTNNATLSDNTQGIEAGIGTVLATIRKKLPGAKILLLGILPQHRPAVDPTIDQINLNLAKLDTGVGTRFLSGTNSFASSNAFAKYYRPGEIHLNSHGYRVWAGLIQPVLADMLDTTIR